MALNPRAPGNRVGPGKAAPWVLIVGAMFGGLTLVGLFVLAQQAARDSQFICNSSILLACIFSLGAALSAAFLGGGAAVHGTFGETATTKAGQIAIGGGVAVLVLVFVMFLKFMPSNCSPTPSLVLEFQDIPSDVRFRAPNVWSRRVEIGEANAYQQDVLLDRQNNRTIKFVNSSGTVCSISLVTLDDRAAAQRFESSYQLDEPFEWGRSDSVSFVFLASATSQDSNSVKVTKKACLKGMQAPFSDLILYLEEERKIVTGSSIAFDEDTDASEQGELEQTELPQKTGWLFGPGPALAAAVRPSYAELTKLLESEDEAVSAQARRYISANFEVYSTDILADIFGGGEVPPSRLAALLSAVVAGLDRETGGAFSPGKKRDFSMQLPFISGNEAKIVELTAHPDGRVAKQARRLIQRYPYDVFAGIYEPKLQAASEGSCGSISQAVLYSAIFFYYNRIIDLNYLPKLEAGDVATANEYAEKVVSASRCLGPDLQPDAALVYYGLALILSEDGGGAYKEQASEAARKFLDFLKGRQEKYYFSKHIEAMKQLAS